MTGTEIITFLSSNFPTQAISPIVGSIFTAIFLRHNTEATEFEKIKAGQFKEVADSLLRLGKMTYTEYYKANNFLKVAKKADEFYSEMHRSENTPPATYDFDWFIRFYEAVGNISDEAMQDLWAKILAGEISRPSSYSLKTIDVLKNMSKKDAELFVRICSHSFTSGEKKIFLPNNNDYLEKCGIEYSDIMKMNEQDLIFSDSVITLSLNISKNESHLFTNRELVMTISSANGSEVEAAIEQYPFTEVGVEVASLFADSASDEDFIEYGRCLARKHKNYVIAIYKVHSWEEDGTIKCERRNILE